MHFTVLVVSDNVEKALAPFQENNMGDCPKKYMTFYPIDLADEGYKTIADAIDDGYAEHEGKAGYWDNPNSRWDWYVLGGRWQGMLRVKKAGMGIKGRSGIMSAPNTEPLSVDSALMSELDLEGMYIEAAGKAGTMYDTAMNIFGELPPNKSYEEILRETAETHSENLAKTDLRSLARIKYREQPRLVALDTAREADPNLYLNADEFLITKEEYITNAKNNVLHTQAILKDGEWHDGDSMDEKEFSELKKNILKELKPDARISIIDCHT